MATYRSRHAEDAARGRSDERIGSKSHALLRGSRVRHGAAPDMAPRRGACRLRRGGARVPPAGRRGAPARAPAARPRHLRRGVPRGAARRRIQLQPRAHLGRRAGGPGRRTAERPPARHPRGSRACGPRRDGPGRRLRRQVPVGVLGYAPRSHRPRRAVSPTPARTSTARIIAAACDILEDEGLEALSMAAVAARVGVRPPSLYKHVRDRDELVGLVVSDTADSLASALAAALGHAKDGDPSERVRLVAREYRAFAARRPRASALLFAGLGPGLAVPQAQLALAAKPVLDVAAGLAGDDAALPAARALTAFVHGFTTMEHAGAFRLGGDPGEAFELGLDALVEGLSRRGA